MRLQKLVDRGKLGVKALLAIRYGYDTYIVAYEVFESPLGVAVLNILIIDLFFVSTWLIAAYEHDEPGATDEQKEQTLRMRRGAAVMAWLMYLGMTAIAFILALDHQDPVTIIARLTGALALWYDTRGILQDARAAKKARLAAQSPEEHHKFARDQRWKRAYGWALFLKQYLFVRMSMDRVDYDVLHDVDLQYTRADKIIEHEQAKTGKAPRKDVIKALNYAPMWKGDDEAGWRWSCSGCGARSRKQPYRTQGLGRMAFKQHMRKHVNEQRS